jgi:hypothetical protein
MTPFKDIYILDQWSWYNLVWDARREWETRFQAVYADGHVGSYGREKFVGRCAGEDCVDDWTSREEFCEIYADNEDLQDFWGLWTN